MLFLKGSSKFAIPYSNIRACIKQLGFLQKAVFPGGCVLGQITQNRPEVKKCGQGNCSPQQPKWCCYKTVDSSTTALQNGACTYQCISKQMHYKTPFSHNGYIKSLELYEKFITLFYLEKNKLFEILYLLRTMHGILPKVVEKLLSISNN